VLKNLFKYSIKRSEIQFLDYQDFNKKYSLSNKMQVYNNCFKGSLKKKFLAFYLKLVILHIKKI